MSDSEVDLLSDPSQKFIPQEDDDETLWEVTEILDEKRTQYKVRWKGNDPKTMKPWKPSWVAKHDCTDDLVREWKRKKQEKQQRKSAKRGRTSTASKRASTASTVKQPLSKATILSTSTRTTVDEATNRRRPSNAANSRSTETATPKKFTRDAIREDEEENEVDQPQKPTKAQKGTKRKRVEADSANSSANQASGRGRHRRHRGFGRRNDYEEEEDTWSSLPPTQLSTASIPAIRQEEGSGDEEEERMVEDALSEGLPSPTRNLEHDMIVEEDFVYPDEQDVAKPEEPQSTKDKGKGKARAVSYDDGEEDDEDESPKATKARPPSSKRKSPLFWPSSPPSPPPERSPGPNQRQGKLELLPPRNLRRQ
ncbi:hypothetical protein NLJ89_g11960 [Agrocybe chaxingu]|uniref:Chromo domain-containing protein n=1 Tax=Agrocybe chaxingu TaxID=84603 RepID=A0A9W8JP44_9AGAR|nr:hypothetical protein NLJ89_g11960 [Agrocybe chaxingu]